MHYVDLNNIDYQDLRKQVSDKLDPRMASLLSKCDVHVYANTYDDKDAAALAGARGEIRFTPFEARHGAAEPAPAFDMLILLMLLSPQVTSRHRTQKQTSPSRRSTPHPLERPCREL